MMPRRLVVDNCILLSPFRNALLGVELPFLRPPLFPLPRYEFLHLFLILKRKRWEVFFFFHFFHFFSFLGMIPTYIYV